ncbi:hypothetical protein [Micromonospora rubida]|uniref:hypothetical protein n=1 Tax=Micromonospora rubida TaxID=2697657 RepID=UPI001377104E|nr:hypothetical protein [Micromonospora rubida]NBE84907.1 hypothetical protein [Micromonospora rubida]
MMSGSPKYTTVALDAARQAQVEAARRRREEERRRRREEARRRRLDAGIAAATARRDALTARLRHLADTARALPQGTEVTAEVARLAALPQPADEAGLARAGGELRRAERRADALTAAVAGELTRREHGRALDLILEPLGELVDRERLDPAGHRSVAALRAEAQDRTGDARRFAETHQRLGAAVGAHLETVRDRQGQLLRLATETDELAGRLAVVLTDAEAAGVAVTGAAELRAEVADLRGERDAGNLSRWEHRADGLRRRVEAVTADVDARLDQLERMAVIVEAASAALPAAGLRVVPGSLAERDATVVFLAQRADGSAIELTVHADDGRGDRLEYRSDGIDTVVETSPDGGTSRCDLTEELLERFHVELDRQGVTADGLHWEGKPGQPRPPARQARERAGHDDRSRQ